MRIIQSEVETVIGYKIPDCVSHNISFDKLDYRYLTTEEYSLFIDEVSAYLMQYDVIRAGSHRGEDWDLGWKENYDEFVKTRSLDSLIPKYHGKYSISRWDRHLVYSDQERFDFNLHKLVIDTILCKLLEGVRHVYEFGCGTGYHLFRLAKYLPTKCFFGLDWTVSSWKIIQEAVNTYPEFNVQGRAFNIAEPDNAFHIEKHSAVVTIAALEQVGKQFIPFVNYLLKEKPEICIHFEPIEELLLTSNAIDILSLMYFRKRNYLSGFLTYLRQLEAQGKVEILEAKRTYSGSKFIEGHSLIVWRPK